MGICVFSERSHFGSPAEKTFKSFIDTELLLKVFPASLDMRLAKKAGRFLASGVSLTLEAKFFGMAVSWVAYVNSFSVNRHFSYVWQKGPAQCWEHDFYFENLPGGGTRVTECVLYRLPAAQLGEWFNRIYFQKYLARTFAYRNQLLTQELSAYKAPERGAGRASESGARRPGDSGVRRRRDREDRRRSGERRQPRPTDPLRQIAL
ncbi:MAG: hypothetical protein JO317_03180 [Verrucomicrobiae bacterium]|nr:hypothetical protein [Verrucomicrobiae bacterium]